MRFDQFLNEFQDTMLRDGYGGALALVRSRHGEMPYSCTLPLLEIAVMQSREGANDHPYTATVEEKFYNRIEVAANWVPPDTFDKEDYAVIQRSEDLVLLTLVQEFPIEYEFACRNSYVRAASKARMLDEAIAVSKISLRQINQKRLRGGRHVLAALNMLGMLLWERGRDELSWIVLRFVEAARREEEPFSISLAFTLQNLASVAHSTSRLDKREEFLIEALRIKESISDIDPLSLSNSLASVADIEAEKGSYKSALVRWKRSIKLAASQLPAGDPIQIRRRLKLAGTLKLLGNLDECREILLECNEYVERLFNEGHISLANRVLSQSADAFTGPASEESSDEFIKLLRVTNEDSDFAHTEALLAKIRGLALQGRVVEAFESLAHVEKLAVENSFYSAWVANARAHLQVLSGQFESALSTSSKALKEIEGRQESDHIRLEQDLLRSLAKAFDGLGKPELALETILKGLNLEHERYLETISPAAVLVSEQEGFQYLRKIGSLGRLLTILEDYGPFDQDLLRNVWDQVALTTALEGHGRHLVRRHIGAPKVPIGHVVKMNRRLVSGDASTKELLASYLSYFEEGTRSFGLDVSRKLQERPIYPGDNETVSIIILTRRVWLIGLEHPHGERTHDWRTDTRSSYFALTARCVDEAVDFSVFCICSEDDLEGGSDSASVIESSALIDELSKSRRVLIVPDGEFWFLPWSALLAGQAPMVQTSAPTILAGAREPDDSSTDYSRSTSSGRFLIVGDVSHCVPGKQSVEGVPFVDLPATAEETKFLRGLTRNLVVLTGREATVTRVIEALVEGPEMFHFAGHGFYAVEGDFRDLGFDHLGGSGSDLTQTGIALAGANDFAQGRWDEEFGTGIILAADLAFLDLSGTRLVFLSGCETAVGSVFPGEGMNGLFSALMGAGVSAVVAAIRPVPDAATAFLVEAFYMRLCSGQDSQTALADAQFEMHERGFSSEAWEHFSTTEEALSSHALFLEPERLTNGSSRRSVG